MARRKESVKEGKEKISKAIESLVARYREISQKVETERRQYAIKLDHESNEDITIKYRLVLRPTDRGIVHTLEILDATEERAAIQIPLLGRNWETVLNHADRVLNAISAEKFREVADLLIELVNRINTGGRSTVTEVE